MKLIALVVGIYAERYLARWSHLREFRPFEEQANRLAEKVLSLDSRAAPYVIAGITLACALPVAIAAWLLRHDSLQILWFVFAVVVLLISFGPRDLKAEALDYQDKAEAGDSEGAKAQAESLIGGGAPEKPKEQAAAVEKATYLEANNRIFGVVFWFLVAGFLGPAFAFGFRALNSLRRYTATLPGGEDLHRAAVKLHGVAAWVPARITSASFALAGNFDDAINAWRGYTRKGAAHPVRRLRRRAGNRGRTSPRRTPRPRARRHRPRAPQPLLRLGAHSSRSRNPGPGLLR